MEMHETMFQSLNVIAEKGEAYCPSHCECEHTRTHEEKTNSAKKQSKQLLV